MAMHINLIPIFFGIFLGGFVMHLINRFPQFSRFMFLAGAALTVLTALDMEPQLVAIYIRWMLQMVAKMTNFLAGMMAGMALFNMAQKIE
ncbi:MAG: hypothetical protein KDI06_03425 [Calditrichaeota bacterium]|nr:hypothetical protein [Calditrichota bacterium]